MKWFTKREATRERNLPIIHEKLEREPTPCDLLRGKAAAAERERSHAKSLGVMDAMADRGIPTEHAEPGVNGAVTLCNARLYLNDEDELYALALIGFPYRKIITCLADLDGFL